ncbi:hypothetical protein UFOVP244_56 [uncultured Caudovirales phage]|uniref:Uncharacterized protein n=1 Tax=uncultured Caudovirales phage TaxID=2100421 RepID=A0A6J7WXY8_9CAUD|nr:hypothetical protein UFOVP244_56 [uncultured Caudovirales phage]
MFSCDRIVLIVGVPEMPIKATGFLQKHWKIIAVASLCVASFMAGLRQGSDSVSSKTTSSETRSETVSTGSTSSKKEVASTKKKKKKVIISKPDGTKIVVITHDESTTTASSADEVKKSDSTTTESKTSHSETSAYQPNYSVSVYKTLPTSSKNAKAIPYYTFGIGRRLIGGLWADSLFNTQDSSLALGFRCEF